MNKELRGLISLVMLTASVVLVICGGFFMSDNDSAFLFLYAALILVYLSIIIK